MCDTCKIVCVCVCVSCAHACCLRLTCTKLAMCAQKLAEMAEVLQARESKLVQLSKDNNDLLETNSILRRSATLTTAIFYFSVCVMTIIFVFYQLGCSSSFFKYYSLFFKYYTEMTLCSGRDVKLQILSPCIVKLLTDLQI